MLHLFILDKKRQELLPSIANAGEGFYLAGGTALALQIGHRDSIDFDFFIEGNIDTLALWIKIQDIFSGYSLIKTQDELNTLSCIIDGDIRLSFFGYNYPLIQIPSNESDLKLASILDIGCMKLSAITSRATLKDYVDLHFILQQISLRELFEGMVKKFPTLDQGLVLKSLVYFDDILPEPILFMPGFTVSLEEVKLSLIEHVKNYWNNTTVL